MKIICIKQHSENIVILGEIYEVYDIDICKCGIVAFNVGLKDERKTECDCGILTTTQIAWIASHIFAKLEEKGQMFIEEFIELEKLNK